MLNQCYQVEKDIWLLHGLTGRYNVVQIHLSIEYMSLIIKWIHAFLIRSFINVNIGKLKNGCSTIATKLKTSVFEYYSVQLVNIL